MLLPKLESIDKRRLHWFDTEHMALLLWYFEMCLHFSSFIGNSTLYWVMLGFEMPLPLIVGK